MESKCETDTRTTLTLSELITYIDDNDNRIELIACRSLIICIRMTQSKSQTNPYKQKHCKRMGLHLSSEIVSNDTETIIDSF